jgi:hypothetical protein
MRDRHTLAFWAIAATLLLAGMAACGPASPPAAPPTETAAPQMLYVDKVNFSPPEPFEGTTYVDIIGNLADACTQIDDIDHGYQDATVHVTITTSRPEGMACAQVLTPFKETIKVRTGNLYPGTYTVIVNGQSFSFPMDFEFTIPLTPDPGS